MNVRLKTQLSGSYVSSFSAHSYGYGFTNELNLSANFWAFALALILGQAPKEAIELTC